MSCHISLSFLIFREEGLNLKIRLRTLHFPLTSLLAETLLTAYGHSKEFQLWQTVTDMNYPKRPYTQNSETSRSASNLKSIQNYRWINVWNSSTHRSGGKKIVFGVIGKLLASFPLGCSWCPGMVRCWRFGSLHITIKWNYVITHQMKLIHEQTEVTKKLN